MSKIDEIIEFWFRPENEEKWWKKDAKFDALIRRHFEGVYEDAAAGKLASWQRTPEGSLALTIALDQFPRNLFRNDPGAYATDEEALACAGWAVQRDFDLRLEKPVERQFLYMPFMHSEDLNHQTFCIDLLQRGGCSENAIKFAYLHKDVIEKYGRFPHRNAVLGRPNTPEEEEYLKRDDAGF